MTHFGEDSEDDGDIAKNGVNSHGSLNHASPGGDSSDEKLPPFTKRQLLTVVMLSFANFCSTVVFSCIAPFFPDEVGLF